MSDLVGAASAILSQSERRVEVVAQNLANVTTPGYKRRVAFTALVDRADFPLEVQRATAEALDDRQGKTILTGSPLDLVITGPGALQAQQRNLDAIAHNVANVNTTGFKRSDMRFVELVTQPWVPASPDAAATPALLELAGVQVAQTMRDFSQGDLRQTDKPLDLAISGDGFLEVLGPGGQTYLWRGGSLRVDADGTLGTTDGLMLKALIDVPAGTTEMRIERDGRVRALTSGETDFTELGQLEVVMPDAVGRLASLDGGYYLADEGVLLRAAKPGEEGAGVLVQGSVETANVDLSTELVALLLTQRAYGASAQVVQAGDQLMAIANGLRR